MEFRLLGPLEVEDDGRPIALAAAKERALLAVLVLRRGGRVSTDRLIDALWGDAPPATALKSVQVYVAHLRRALGSDRIVTHERGYELIVADGEVDLDRFERLVAQAVEAEPRRAAELLGEALRLVRGAPLADLALEPWAVPEAAVIEERVLEATEARIDAELALGRHRRLVAELEELFSLHPYREHLLEQLMLALYRSGRQAEALKAYRAGVDRLRTELGLEPGPDLRELERGLLRHDEELAGPAEARRFATERRSWRLITVGALAILIAGAAAFVVILTWGDGTALARVPPGVAVVDARNGRLVAHIDHAEIGAPVEAVTGSGAFWVWNLRPFSLVEVSRDGKVENRIASPFGGDAGWFLPTGHDVWFTGSKEVVRVDQRLAEIVDRIPVHRPQGRFGLSWLTLCAGSMWVADADNGSVLRFDAGSGALRARIPVENAWAIACGDGGLWVTSNYTGLRRIDPATNSLVATAPIPTHLDEVAVAGGFAWTTDEQRGTLYKVDGTGRIAATYNTGDGARQISYAGGRIWVANQDVGTVTGVDVTTGDVRTLRFGHPVQMVAALGNRLLVGLNEGLTYEDRIDHLRGSVVKLIVPAYVFDPPDPALADNPWTFPIERATCSMLLAFSDPAHNPTALQPDLAARMPRVSNDGRTYTFVVRSGRRFAPPSNAFVTPESVRRSIERALSPKLADETPGAHFLPDIVGTERFRSGQSKTISGIRVRGASISFTIRTASRTFLSRLSLPFFCTVPVDTPTLPNGVPSVAPPSAGPYYMADRFNGEYMILKRNPHYSGQSAARLDAIAFREGLSPENAVGRVEAGDWDGAILDDPLLEPDSRVARHARSDPTLRYTVITDVTAGGPAPPIFALLGSRLGCGATKHDQLDLAALCIRRQD
ncbi:MAG: BTAD domain-containing putative transcriptional regulator [Gaiellaceae bacterium]